MKAFNQDKKSTGALRVILSLILALTALLVTGIVIYSTEKDYAKVEVTTETERNIPREEEVIESKLSDLNASATPVNEVAIDKVDEEDELVAAPERQIQRSDGPFNFADDNSELVPVPGNRNSAEATSPDELAPDKKLEGAIQRLVGKEEDNTNSKGNSAVNGQSRNEALFSKEDLAELAAETPAIFNPTNNLLPGISRSNRDKVVNTPVPQPTATPTATATPEEEEEIDETEFTGQARGYAILYLMHPNARAAVERLVQNMLDSKVKELYLGVLTDGTFGKDFNYLADVIQRLSVNGRNLTLALYLSNGASQRHYNVTPIDAPFVKTEPQEFRRLIKEDYATQQRFVAMVREVLPVFQLNASLNPENSNVAVMMLEDNLDGDAYAAMRELAQLILGNLVSYIRNPCQGCYGGNDSDSRGDPLEYHRFYELPKLGPQDGFTTDGEGYYFDAERPGNNNLSISELQAEIRNATIQGLRYFGLWRAERQGLRGGVVLNPDQRQYEVPTDTQLEIEKELLQLGLNPVLKEEDAE